MNTQDIQVTLRQLPSVDRLLNDDGARELIAAYGRGPTTEALRQALDSTREDVREGAALPEVDALIERASAYLERRLAPTLRPTINAAGVIIHTNLGRAPLSRATRVAMDAVSRGYSTLEYDLDAGQRGHRTLHAERLLCELTGAESALVVNNNAGAVLLALSGLAQGHGVLISRGQLVEIGGGFRIPDVMAQSGAHLIEVGTTNRTHLQDYVKAIKAALYDPDAAAVELILRVHHSNYRIVGFAAEPTLAELVDLGREHGVPVMDDLGSGALLDTAPFGLVHEPMVQESVAAGATVVCFSGDKLLGGPQAGVIVGKAAHIDPLKSHPLARALRPDKLCLAGLQATLLHYLRDEAIEQIPVWRMIAAPLAEIETRARRWQETLYQEGIEAEITDGASTVGGGSLPGETLPTRLLALPVAHPDRLAAALREGPQPVVARIEDERLVLDPRTVLPEEEDNLLKTIENVLSQLPRKT
ncbi:MAG TPA: L-seryl-tRNA(Sec) selenium transferase [Chloroflexi bacterium]|nr:L-seryl-tRNA(Sec) selenium transferase [Chloroflexota bacterium]